MNARRSRQAPEEIIVTGSRIARAGYDQPTPVTVIGAEAIEKSGFSNVSDILNRTPQVGVGLGSSNSYFNADAGASFVNLRGLGTNRTLVLVNGRRRVSGTQLSSAVDLTTIPSNLIGNIEVITGGAAAVYGADAVTGVVNVTLKQDGTVWNSPAARASHRVAMPTRIRWASCTDRRSTTDAAGFCSACRITKKIC